MKEPKEPKISDVLKLLDGATWRVDRCDKKALNTTVGPYRFSIRDFGTSSCYTQLSIRDEEGMLVFILSGDEISDLYDKISDKDRLAELNSLRRDFNCFLSSQLEERA